jgi:hypothetical protein
LPRPQSQVNQSRNKVKSANLTDFPAALAARPLARTPHELSQRQHEGCHGNCRSKDACDARKDCVPGWKGDTHAWCTCTCDFWSLARHGSTPLHGTAASGAVDCVWAATYASMLPLHTAVCMVQLGCVMRGSGASLRAQKTCVAQPFCVHVAIALNSRSNWRAPCSRPHLALCSMLMHLPNSA